MLLEVGVAQGRRAARAQAVAHGEDDPAAGLAALEAAVAVDEAAVTPGERRDGALARVERAHFGDGLAHLLAVGADVLDGRGPDEPRDPGETLEAGPAALDGAADEVVPRLAGRRGQVERAAGLARGDAAEVDLHHERVHALVGDDEVRAPAQHAERDAARPRPGERVEHRGLLTRLDEPARGAADGQRGARRQRDALARRHRRAGGM